MTALAGTDVLTELVERMGPACAEAVDPLELAAVLESEGITDSVASGRYAAANVFELAEMLYHRTTRAPAQVVPEEGPWRPRPGLHLARGVLFVLPGMAYASAGNLVRDGAAVSVVLVGLVLSWTYAQTVAYLGYARLGMADRAGAHRLLRGGTLVAVGAIIVMVAVTAGVDLAVGGAVPVAAVGVAAAQAAYLVAATVVLVCAREGLLAVALAPCALAGAAWLLGWVAADVAMGASVASVAATIAVAGYATRDAAGRGAKLSLAELGSALPHGAFGLLAAGLLVFVPASVTWFGAGTGRVALLALPLTFSMGSAEWIMIWYRAAMHRVARRVRHLAAFRAGAVVRLSVAFAAYLGALAAIMVLTVVLDRAGLTHRSGWQSALRFDPARFDWDQLDWSRTHSQRASTWMLGLGGYLALGGALFLAMLLVAARMVAPVLLVFCTAVCAEYLAICSGQPALLVQLVVATVATVTLFGLALVGLSRAVRHA